MLKGRSARIGPIGERRLEMVNSVLERETPPAPPVTATGLMVISYLQLRLYVGIIGVVLPWVLVVGSVLEGSGVEPSLSGYYYTPMRNIFVGALCALAVFFVAYRGYDRADSAITNVAGVGTIATALCPTTTPDNPTLFQVIIGDLHLFFSCLAFVMLAVMALRFAKRSPTPAGLPLWPALGYAFGFTGAEVAGAPRWDVVAYRVCGFTILLCIALIYPGSLLYSNSLLILETILMTAFGVSWFVKGRKLLSGRVTAYDGPRAPAIPAG